jgi:hypothetical protein
MKMRNQQGDRENDGLVEYLRLWKTLQLKRPTKDLKTVICLSPQHRETNKEGKKMSNV